MENKICQSCGMPMTEPGHFGSDADESRNEDYCVYCYVNGSFTTDCSMEEMIQFCTGMLEEYNKDAEEKMTRDQVVEHMRSYFPRLKRWKTQ